MSQTAVYEDMVLRAVSYFGNVLYLYNVVRDAAEVTIQQKHFFEENSIKLIDPQTNKIITTENKGPKKIVEYIPDDITIYGGSAVTLYDSHLRLMNERAFSPSSFKLQSPYDITRRRTEDIDMVWWPRVSAPKGELFLSDSKGLKALVDAFEAALMEPVANLFKYIFAPNGSDEVRPAIDTKYIPGLGVYQLIITLKIGSESYKISEISIHDGRQSQDPTRLSGMSENIYFTRANANAPQYAQSFMLEFPFKDVIKGELFTVRVPQMSHFIEQQIYAMQQFLNNPRTTDKFVKLWKRMFYLYLLFDHVKVNIAGEIHAALQGFAIQNAALLKQKKAAILESEARYVSEEMTEIQRDFQKAIKSNEEVQAAIQGLIKKNKEISQSRGGRQDQQQALQQIQMELNRFYGVREQIGRLIHAKENEMTQLDQITKEGGFINKALYALYLIVEKSRDGSKANTKATRTPHTPHTPRSSRSHL